MKAVVLDSLGGPEKLTLRDIERKAPGPGEVSVKLAASALNRRDLWITRGKYPKIELPCVPGSDGAGVIDALGDGVQSDLLGQQVVIYPAKNWGPEQRHYGPDFRVLGMPDQGTFAEYICVSASDVYPKPAHLDWPQAAAIPLAGLTAWRAVTTQGDVQPGQRVLITGAGSGVSTFAILWCLNLGAEVYVSSGSDEKLAAAKVMGVAGGENYRDPTCYKKLRQQSGGFHTVIDSAGGDALNSILDSLLPGGRLVCFGATLGNPTKGLELAKLFFRQVRIQGTTMGSNAEFSAMIDFVTEHRILPVIDRVMALKDAVAAHQRMEAFSHTGKIVLLND